MRGEAGMIGRQPGFWDVEERLRELSAQGDPLEKLAATVDFEIFRTELEAAAGRRDPWKGGRPSFDAVLKFRMLVLQAMHGLSLAQTEYLVADRLSWMRFCGLGPGDAVPDANTLWDFREALIGAGALEALFARLDRAITEAGYLPMSGQIVDGEPLERHWSERQWRTLIAAPRQRNTEDEKARIKAGESADAIWPDKPARARQKDVDARWTVKFSKAKPAADGKPQTDIAIPVFGYKSHISIDRRHGVRRGARTGGALAPHSGAARSRMQRRMTGPGCARAWSTRTTPARMSGPTAPTAPQRTSGSCGAPARPAASTGASRKAGRCRSARRGRTRRSRRSARPSSTRSPTRRASWASSSAPSAWRAPKPPSRSPTWPTT
jgi:hypothetical protein